MFIHNMHKRYIPLFWLLFLLITLFLSSGKVMADGFIVITENIRPVPGHFTFAPLAVRYHKVKVTINGNIATTRIDQEFYNPNNRRLEGTYIFPIPQNATIDRFSMDVNGKDTEAELLSADKARKIYEDIVRKAKDPALLEYIGRGALKARIFPIEPKSPKKVSITYTQVLTPDNNVYEYVYPLNTEKFSSTLINDVSVSVDIKTTSDLKNIYCPTHKTIIKRDGMKQAQIDFNVKNSRPDKDFKVVFSTSPKPLGLDMVVFREGDEDGYFMLMASAGNLAADDRKNAKDICFVLDTSGSMSGKKIIQAKKSLQFCIDNLNDNDRFEIIRFSTESEALFGKLVQATAENREKAGKFTDGFKPIGGTAIHEALTSAVKLRNNRDGASRPYHIVFITDGLPTVGETDQKQIIKAVTTEAAAGTRIFCFGLGYDVNTHLLDTIATDTRALSQYVTPEEDMEVKLSNLYTRIANPVFTDISFETGSGIRLSKVHPRPLPDLFKGQTLLVFGRYNGSGEIPLIMKGNLQGTRQSISKKVAFRKKETANSFIPKQWATRRVGWLLDQIRRNGESKELREEVTALARKHGIVTPYTSYLIIEDEQRRNVPLAQQNFRELNRNSRARSAASSSMDSLRNEALHDSRRSGEKAVVNSKTLQRMHGYSIAEELSIEDDKKAKDWAMKPSVPAIHPKKQRGYHIKDNFTQQVKSIAGRTFYLNDNIWNDSKAQSLKNPKQVNIKFGSDDYFKLLGSNDQIAQWLSLGQNVDIIFKGTLYQIRN